MSAADSQCPRCGGELRPTTVDTCYTVSGRTVLFENVPAEVCGQCGERIYSLEVAQAMSRIVVDRPTPTRIVPIDAYDLALDRSLVEAQRQAS